MSDTPRSDALKAEIPHPRAIEDMLASHYDLEAALAKIMRIANNAIYFVDTSDYHTALYKCAVAAGMEDYTVGEDYIEEPE